jgi:hypothetical protein
VVTCSPVAIERLGGVEAAGDRRHHRHRHHAR